MLKFYSTLLPLTTCLLVFTAATHAQQVSSESLPSLPVPAPPEERIELQASEYYSVAIDGVKPTPFNARSKAAEVGARSAVASTVSQLRSLPPQSEGFVIKAGAFRLFENAQRLHARLFSIGSARITHRSAKGQDYYGVYLGPWKTKTEAQQAYELALDAGMQDGEIIAPQNAR